MSEDHITDMRERIVDIQERLSVQHMTDHDMLIRLNALSEGIAQQLTRLADGHAEQAASVDTRLRALEQARWTMLGAAGAIGAIAGLAVQALVVFLRK